MGGIANAVSNVVSNVSPLSNPMGLGSQAGGFLGGMGGGIADAAGATSQFQAQQAQLLEQQNLIEQINQAQAGAGQLQGNQQALAQALLANSQGQGAAQQVMQQAQERANMQGAGMLAGARGVNPALAARLSAQQNAAGQQAVSAGAGQLALQAQGQLGNLYGQMGQQNLGQQQIAQQALQGTNESRMRNLQGTQGINAQTSAQNAQVRGQLAGGILGGIGAGVGKLAGGAGGGFVPGQAPVGGNSYANDVVPAMLSPGEIVVPRSHSDDAESAKAFIDQLLKSEGEKKKKGA